jgi:iron-sulfur cluster assembly protein
MVTVSEAATRKITEVITQQREAGAEVFGLRLSVYQGGCSGFQYGMSLADRAEAGDWVGEFGGVKVLVDADSAPLLQGVSIDYVETLQAQGFTIQNPNAVRGCGCGKSFETSESETEGASGGGCGCGGH